jgi:two-component system sensor histidine kinase KdpD
MRLPFLPGQSATLGRRAAKFAARLLAVLLAIGLITTLYREFSLTNATTVALSFLLVVLAVAARWGLVEGVVASVAATLCFNYFFLPPVGTWTIADPQNWIALVAFLVVSIVGSQLSERARRKTREAIEHQGETERLYTLSRMILMLGGSPAHVAGEVSRLIRQVFEASCVVLFHRESDQIFRTGQEEVPLSDVQLKELTLQGNVVEDTEKGFTALPVTLGGKSLGSLGVLGASLSDGARQAVANLVAIALEGAHSREVAGHAELVRHSEEFKSTLLDALAHELKTPLTSVKASVSALLTHASGLSADQRELLSIVEEETDRLNRLVTEATQMARIEAGKLRLNRETCSAEALIRGALEDTRRLLEGREVRVGIASGLPPVTADVELIRTVLRHLLDNGAKYSSQGKPIRISAEVEGQQVRISVTDQGPGLSEQELSRVFEKYYRGAGTRELVPGIGMGLAIARDIVVAHGGRIWAESSPGQGSRFSFTLPPAREGPHA